MIVLLSIFQYLLQTVTDVLDKFLISKRKVEPVNYTFYTVVTGLVLLLAWPWVYHAVPVREALFSAFSGAWFSLAMFVFYLALRDGEVSRVIPFVYGLVPLFDIAIEWVLGQGVMQPKEAAVMWLLIPGALLVSYRPDKKMGKHVMIKVTAALLLSVYFALWHAASHNGPVLNDLMWNRIGAALVLLIPLALPWYRRKVFTAEKVEQKKNTAFWFLFKQALGGATFIFLSYLLAVGQVSLINALQGFRYVFLFFIALFLSRKFRHILEEETSHRTIRQKIFGICLIFLGTIILFL